MAPPERTRRPHLNESHHHPLDCKDEGRDAERIPPEPKFLTNSVLAALVLSLSDPGQRHHTPKRIRPHHAPDASRHQPSRSRFHQIRRNTGNENQQEGDSSQQESRASNMRMRHSQADKHNRQQQGSGVAEVAGARRTRARSLPKMLRAASLPRTPADGSTPRTATLNPPCIPRPR